MVKLIHKIEIEAPVEKVFDMMLGLSDKKTYEYWAAIFNPTSTFEGNREKGSKMLFLGTGEDGSQGGMISKIAEIILNQYVSIHHYGILQNWKEITEGPEAEQWAGGYENYTFTEKDGVTTVLVELNSAEDFVDYFNETYPKALEKLKEIVEKS